MAKITQEQANRIFEAGSFEEKKRLALEAGLSEEEINQSLGRGTIQRLSQGGRERQSAKTQPLDPGPEPEEIAFDPSDEVVDPSDDFVADEEPESTQGTEDDKDSAAAKASKLTTNAILDNYNFGTQELASIVQNKARHNLTEIRQQNARLKAQTDKQEIVQAANSGTETDSKEIELTAMAAFSEMDKADQEALEPKVAAARAALGADATDEAVAELAAQYHLAEKAKEALESVGLGDKITEIAKSFLPGQQLLRNYTITGSVFNAEEELQGYYNFFQGLSPAEKVMEFENNWRVLREEVGDDAAVRLLLPLLDPAGEFSYPQFSQSAAIFESILSTLDLPAVEGITKLAKLRGLKGATRNIPKTLEESGMRNEAGDATAANVVDETGEVQSAENLDRSTAALQASGYDDFALHDSAYTSGIARESQEAIDRTRANIRSTTGQILAGELTLLDNPISANTLKRLQTSTAEELARRPNIQNIRAVARNDEAGTVSFAFDVIDPESGTLVNKVTRAEFKAKFNDVGKWEIDNTTWLGAKLKSNTALAKAANEGYESLAEDVSSMIRIEGFEKKMTSDLEDLVSEAMRPILGRSFSLSKKNPLTPKFVKGSARDSIAKVDAVMRHLDKQDIDYVPSPGQLRSGEFGVQLTEEEIQAFYNLREVFHSMQVLRNARQRSIFDRQGVKSVQFVTDTGEQVDDFAKVYNRRDEAQGFLNSAQPPLVWDNISKRAVSRAELDLDNLYDQGYRLVDTQQAFRAGNSNFTTALVKSTDVGELPIWVVPYRTNYVPRIYKRGSYFVKTFTPITVNGRRAEDIETGAPAQALRQFDNKAEAERFVEELRTRHANEIEELENKPELSPTEAERLDALKNAEFRVLRDRQVERELGQSGNVAFTGGGPFTGTRSEKAIPFGLTGEEADTLDVYSALQRNINNVSRFYTRSEHIAALKQKWIKTAQAMGRSDVTKYGDELKGGGTDIQWLNRVKAAIDDFSGVPEAEVTIWADTMQSMLDWAMRKALGTPFERLVPRKALTHIIHQDPVMQLRASAFHLLLGWFNPIQLYVQGTGAALALSENILNPVEMGRVIGRQSLLTAIENNTDLATIRRMSKAVGIPGKEMEEIHKFWRRSGLRESVRATADYAAVAKNQSVTMGTIRGAADNGLLFYRAGELFNRRVSYITAFRKWRKANPNAIITPEVERKIVSDANNFMLNLHKANRAQWQKGILSLPTQFWQVNAKLLEAVFGRNSRFTPSQRLKIVLGQGVFYGAAGIPMGSYGVKLASEWLGYDQAEIDPDVARSLNGGLVDNMFYWAFNEEIEAADRAAIFSGLEDFVYDMFIAEAPLTEKLLGASSVPLERGFRFIKQIGLISSSIDNDIENIQPMDFIQAGESLLKFTSTWNQIDKAFYMHQYGYIRNRWGNEITLPGSENDFQKALATALGFNTTQLNTIRDIKGLNRARRQYRDRRVRDIVVLMSDFIQQIDARGWENIDEQEKEMFRNKIRFMLAPIDDPKLRQDVGESVVNQIQTGEDEQARQIRQFFENGLSTTSGEILGLTSPAAFRTQGILRADTIDERQVEEEQ